MIWDVRVWSFFMWLVASCLYLGGFATPYRMPGNRISVAVAFGGDVDPTPKGTRIGVWGEVPDEFSGTFMAIRAVLSIGVAMILVTFISYILLCKIDKTVVQVVAFVFQLLAGVFGLVAIGIYRAASDQLGEGFWMVAFASGLYLVNGLVLVFMPWMEYQTPKWKNEEDVPLTTVKA